MKSMIWTTAASLVLTATMGIVGCGKEDGAAGGSGGGAGNKKIAVIAKSTVNAYWKAVEAGAKQAAAEEKVEIVWTGPDAETNHSQQANMVDNMVNTGVAGIVLAPTNTDALVRPVESAVQRGVPVLIIDSTVKSDKPISVIATDNYAAGKQAAEALAKAIGDKKKHGGKVLMLRFLEGSGSTEAREKGFIDGVKAVGLTLIADTYTRGTGSTTDAFETADALLRGQTKDNVLQVDGIFASNQPTAMGMLARLKTFKQQGNTVDAAYVGFDAHEVLLKGVRDGDVAAIVTQDPKMMGYTGVKEMVKHLNGTKIEPTLSTKVATVTKENIDTPEIKAVTLE